MQLDYKMPVRILERDHDVAHDQTVGVAHQVVKLVHSHRCVMRRMFGQFTPHPRTAWVTASCTEHLVFKRIATVVSKVPNVISRYTLTRRL